MEWETTPGTTDQGQQTTVPDRCDGDAVPGADLSVQVMSKVKRFLANITDCNRNVSSGSLAADCKSSDSGDEVRNCDTNDNAANVDNNTRHQVLLSTISNVLDTSMRMNDTSMRMNDTNMRMNDTSMKMNDTNMRMNDTSMRNTEAITVDFERSYTATIADEHTTLGDSANSCSQSPEKKPSTVSPCKLLVIRGENGLTREDRALSSQIFDTDASNQTESSHRGSILHQFETTGTAVVVRPFGRSIKRASEDKRVRVANLACIDSNFNIAFITDIERQPVYTTMPNSDIFNDHLMYEHIEPSSSSDPQQIEVDKSSDIPATEILKRLNRVQRQNNDRTFPSRKKHQRLTLTPYCPEDNYTSTGSASNTLKPSTTCSSFDSLAANIALLSKSHTDDIITKTEIQSMHSAVMHEQLILHESMEIDNGGETQKIRFKKVISGGLTPDTSSICFLDDVNMADNPISLSNPAATYVPLVGIPNLDFPRNKVTLLITSNNKRNRSSMVTGGTEHVAAVTTNQSILAKQSEAANSNDLLRAANAENNTDYNTNISSMHQTAGNTQTRISTNTTFIPISHAVNTTTQTVNSNRHRNNPTNQLVNPTNILVNPTGQLINPTRQPANPTNQTVNPSGQSVSCTGETVNPDIESNSGTKQTANVSNQCDSFIQSTAISSHQTNSFFRSTAISSKQTGRFIQSTAISSQQNGSFTQSTTISSHQTGSFTQTTPSSTSHIHNPTKRTIENTKHINDSTHRICNSIHPTSNSSIQASNSANKTINSTKNTTKSTDPTSDSAHQITNNNLDQTKCAINTTNALTESTILNYIANNISNTTNYTPTATSHQMFEPSQQPDAFSVPYSKPTLPKAHLKLSDSYRIESSSCDSRFPQPLTSKPNSTATPILLPSPSNRGGKNLAKLNCLNQISSSLSTISNGRHNTPRNAAAKITLKTDGNKTDMPVSKINRDDFHFPTSGELMKSPRDNYGCVFQLISDGKPEMISSQLGSDETQGLEEDNNMETSASPLAVDYRCTATAANNSSDVNIPYAVIIDSKPVSSHQNEERVLAPLNQTMCSSPVDLDRMDDQKASSVISTVALDAETLHPPASSLMSLADSSAADSPPAGTTTSMTPSTGTSAGTTASMTPSTGTSAGTTASMTPSTGTSAATDSSVEGMGRRLRNRNQRKFLPEKTRHKRQTLQDMTRPLKQWLYKNRANPYPSKHDKMELVATSNMSLTQVSNWFANARRRLKNTVCGDGLTWAKRITEYNHCAEGNAELFSIPSSDEEEWGCEEEGNEPQETGINGEPLPSQSNTSSPSLTHTSPFSDSALGLQTLAQSLTASHNGTTRCSPALDDQHSNHHKYKHSILQRYLQDASQQALVPVADLLACRARHRHLSSSTGSHDFEYLSTSSVSSPSHETPHDSFDEFSEEFETIAIRRRVTDNPAVHQNDDMYWKEIGAALALTSLARSHISK